MWRSERRLPGVPELLRREEEYISHCSLFNCRFVGKASGEVTAEIKNEELSTSECFSYGTM